MDENNIEEPAETPEYFSDDLNMLSTASHSSKLMLEPVLNSTLELWKNLEAPKNKWTGVIYPRGRNVLSDLPLICCST